LPATTGSSSPSVVPVFGRRRRLLLLGVLVQLLAQGQLAEERAGNFALNLLDPLLALLVLGLVVVTAGRRRTRRGIITFLRGLGITPIPHIDLNATTATQEDVLVRISA